MLRFHRSRLHHERFPSLKGHDWVSRLTLPTVSTATVIGQLDDLLKVCCLSIGGQSILMFGGLDTINDGCRVPGHRAEKETGVILVFLLDKISKYWNLVNDAINRATSCLPHFHVSLWLVEICRTTMESFWRIFLDYCKTRELAALYFSFILI